MTAGRRRPGGVGYAARFRACTEFLDRYEVRVVGGSEHQEYRRPAEELEEFNRNIAGEIELIAECRGQPRADADINGTHQTLMLAVDTPPLR